MGADGKQSGDLIERAKRLALRARALCNQSGQLRQELSRIRYEVRKQRATLRQYPAVVERLKSIAGEHRPANAVDATDSTLRPAKRA